jgi:hypothetical protein
MRRIAGVRIVLDSGAWPPDNPHRLSRDAYARAVRAWCGNPAFAWACTYDTIGNAKQTDHDHAWLLAQPWPHAEPPIVPVIHYPQSTAEDIIGELLRDLELLDQEERHSTALGTALGAVDGPVDWPACAIGGLVPARYATDAAAWYEELIAALEAADTLCPFMRRIHLLGISRASWVLRSPLVISFDTSLPARQASYGWAKIAPSYTEAHGLSPAKLQRSREARLVYWICFVRAAAGLPWQAVNQALLRDDVPSRSVVVPQHTQLRLDWTLDDGVDQLAA